MRFYSQSHFKHINMWSNYNYSTMLIDWKLWSQSLTVKAAFLFLYIHIQQHNVWNENENCDDTVQQGLFQV